MLAIQIGFPSLSIIRFTALASCGSSSPRSMEIYVLTYPSKLSGEKSSTSLTSGLSKTFSNSLAKASSLSTNSFQSSGLMDPSADNFLFLDLSDTFISNALNLSLLNSRPHLTSVIRCTVFPKHHYSIFR